MELRDRWLNPPAWVEWVDEPVPGYPKRPIARSQASATAATWSGSPRSRGRARSRSFAVYRGGTTGGNPQAHPMFSEVLVQIGLSER